jgi:hypothetical protein
MERMKRLALLAVFLLALVVPTVSLAQNNPGPVWDLTQTFTVTDLGFTFKFPKDWVNDTSNGIVLAATQDDIKAFSDDDPKTQPEGAVITINAVQISALKAQVGSDPTLDDLANLVVKSGDIKETEARVEIPVMTRRSISVIGTSNANGRGGIATIWRQGDFLVIATASAPDMKEMIRLSYSWGQVIGSMSPVDAQPLSDTPLQLQAGGFEVSLPQKWYQSTDGSNIFYELKDDMKNNSFKGDVIAVGASALKDIGLTEKSTLNDVVDYNIKQFGLEEPIRREEFIILGQPALTIRGADKSGQWALVTQVIVDGKAISLAAAAPDEDKLNQFEPTWIAILKSVQALST